MIALFFLALALAMDAFAVSLIRGSVGPRGWRPAFTVAFSFGAAQGVMPLFGWLMGQALAGSFEQFDHWIAFCLLGVLGVRMVHAGLSNDDEEVAPGPLGLPILSLMVAAFATSVDAAVAGITLPLLGLPVPVACFVIAGVTGIICFFGYRMGARMNSWLGHYAEVFGGIVLIVLGIKILIEHLSA